MTKPEFNSGDSDSRIRGRYRCYVDGERDGDAHGDGGGQNGGDDQRNDDGNGGDWATCLEQKHTTLRPNPGHIGWWRVYRMGIQVSSQTPNTQFAVGVGHTLAETGLHKVVVVDRGSTEPSLRPWRGWELEQLRLLAGTVESAVGQPLAKERPLGYHRQ